MSKVDPKLVKAAIIFSNSVTVEFTADGASAESIMDGVFLLCRNPESNPGHWIAKAVSLTTVLRIGLKCRGNVKSSG